MRLVMQLDNRNIYISSKFYLNAKQIMKLQLSELIENEYICVKTQYNWTHTKIKITDSEETQVLSYFLKVSLINLLKQL
jgi:hypothetical protein